MAPPRRRRHPLVIYHKAAEAKAAAGKPCGNKKETSARGAFAYLRCCFPPKKFPTTH